MKKNLKTCVERPQYGEPIRLLEPADPEIMRAAGLTPDPARG